ncbi:MAG: trypsin-like serine protease, partial [Lachnospiraceae bacterium]|nr:trypsin-like serine protease [Lachnospiraceae bacterium]
MDDKFYNEEMKDNEYRYTYRKVGEEKNNNEENAVTRTEVNNFVMKEPEPENNEIFRETKKEPKHKKGGILKFVAALLIISVVGGASAGASYGLVKHLVKDNNKKTSTLETTSTETVMLASKEPNAAIEVINRVFPSVVNISISGTTNQNYYGFTIPYEFTSAGSGIIFSEDESKIYIATNNHVVDGATNISVSVGEEDGVKATVVGKDPSSDLAVISVLKDDLEKAGVEEVRIAKFGDSDSINVGEDVIAIGNALGEGKVATGGMISSKLKTITVDDIALTVIQTDSAINPGNSGGALVNYSGQVIGVNTAKISSSQIEGVGYAIPSNIALPILEQLLEEGTVPKPYIGIVGMDVDDELSYKYGLPVGAYITQVLENSGAAEAGLQEGD